MVFSPERHSYTDSSGSYFSLPKTVGEVPTPVLLEIAEKHREIGQTDNDRISLRHNEIASSAIVEAMLVSSDPDHLHDDLRLGYIDTAADYLSDAVSAKLRLIEEGLEPPSSSVQLQRMMLNFDFMDVYKDIICGEITDHTRQELRRSLQNHIRELERQYRYSLRDHDLKAQISGLKGEVIALDSYWEKRDRTSDPIALPATTRGGDGNERSSETHDIILFSEQQQGVFVYTGAREVKAGKIDLNRALHNLIRYVNPILHVDTETRSIREIS